MSVNFLREYVSLFEETEVPPRFAHWCGLSCLSAVLERRVWLDFGIFTVYPNMYVVLVAAAGQQRKSTAIDMTEDLLRSVDPGPRIIGQKLTPEALIEALKVVRTDDPTQLLQETCGGIVLCDEFVTFLNKRTHELGLSDLLTSFWDCKKHFEYRTRGHGIEEINFGHLSILGGTTPHNLKGAIPIDIIGAGVSSRIIFIYSDKVQPPCPRPRFTERHHRIKETLITHLRTLTTLAGDITIEPDAAAFFDTEYEQFYHHSPFWAGDDFVRGYASRRGTHLLKTAICLMASERPDELVVTKQNLVGAKILLEEQVEADLPRVFDAIMSTEIGITADRVLQLIKNSPDQTITRSDLIRKFAHRLSGKELTDIVETLIKADYVKATTFSGHLAYTVDKE